MPVNIYDTAHRLAAEIRNSDEAKQFQRTKALVYANDNDRRMIADFKKMQFEAQASLFSGQEPSSDLMQKLHGLGEILALNPKITEFFAAEYAMQTMARDLYKIISEACDLEMPSFEE